MSSNSSARSPAARSIAARMTAAAISSGRVADSAPFGAFPTAVRTAETITGVMVFLNRKHKDTKTQRHRGEIPGQTGQTRTYQFTGLTGLTWNFPSVPL